MDEIRLHTEPPYHIAQHSFSFPLIAKPGQWKAEVHYGSNPQHQLKAETVFDVTAYELPLFKTEITVPRFVFEYETQVAVSIKVMKEN